ncbi:MAG: spore maturation protein A [Oscillospiraceae bacterium]|nr:spore maturation protein A [Oscillospiraceae bacterium]
MSVFISVSILLSLVFSAALGQISELSNNILTASEGAVKLTLTLLGSMAFWGGVMRIAEKSGFTKNLAVLFRPILRKLFAGIAVDGKAFNSIVMNITANIIGMGNAATPLGIKAIKELAKEEGATDYATRNIISFVVINTASIQLIPTTIATLRAAHGSSVPMEILPSVIVTSCVALFVGLTLVFILDGVFKNRGVKKHESE